MKRLLTALVAATLAVSATTAYAQTKKDLQRWFGPMCSEIQDCLESHSTMKGNLKVERVKIAGGTLQIYFSPWLAERYLRPEDMEQIFGAVSANMPSNYASYKHKFEVYSNNTPLDDLMGRFEAGQSRNEAAKSNAAAPEKDYPLVKNISRKANAPKGLDGRHIAVWQSHGSYYDQAEASWKWQRPRLFQTCEDIYTQSYVLPYLVPMLEKAGAVVMLPRERDLQLREAIADNDAQDGSYIETNGEKQWKDAGARGFAQLKVVYHDGENPFADGTARAVESIEGYNGLSYATWTPQIEEDGEYAVYVSYATLPNSTRQAEYEVRHDGGSTLFHVNQTMGGGTWIYLGTFGFSKGSERQGVVLTNKTGAEGETVTADAVRFGGGTGNIARTPSKTDEDGKERIFEYEPEEELSGYPRWAEGSRMWLQWAGLCDTIYSNTRFTNDYKDDYKSRALWVNAMLGGSARNPRAEGYRIPLDLSLAFHSDAGVTPNDSIVGTLAIYTKVSDGEEQYPSGGKRIVARELCDIVQSQVVSDIRASFEPEWNRRGMWDKSYYESRVPFVPSMILELLSHQNFADMRYGLDPSFRFTVSRAVYKGMLRFLAYVNDCDYVVQPLPVEAFAADIKDGSAVLRWQSVSDPLEPTAEAEKFILYTRITELENAGRHSETPGTGEAGFDNGTIISGTTATVKLQPGKIYSFKIAALNEGGESLPSEILSVGLAHNAKGTVMVLNNFSRVAAPSSFTQDSTLAGFDDATDSGVPYMRDISFAGDMFEFDRLATSAEVGEAASFGSCNADYEDKIVAGNFFDYPSIHGAAIMKAGWSFVSANSAALEAGLASLEAYPACDLVCGKQARTLVGRYRDDSQIRYCVFPEYLRAALSDYAAAGGKLLVSGAYIASDCQEQIYDYPLSRQMQAEMNSEKSFLNEVLHISRVNGHACRSGQVLGIKAPYGFGKGEYSYSSKPCAESYCVESPDGIAPAGGGHTIMRYGDTGISAAVAWKGENSKSVAIGFPLETLVEQQQIDRLMRQILNFFE